MPEPDGRILSRDLCDQSVAERIIQNLAVTTDKIAYLAIETAQIGTAAVTKLKVGDQQIDVQRMLEPLTVDTNENMTSNVSLTTAATKHASFDFTIPSWVGTAHIMAFAMTQLTNSYGATLGAHASARIGSLDDGASTQDIANGEVGNSMHVEERNITSPGATIEAANYAFISASTNSANAVAVWAHFTGLR